MSPAGSCPSGAPSSDSSRGSGAVFSTLLWSRKVSSELRIAEGDPDWRALRGVGVLVAGGRARTRRRIRGARSGGAGGPVAVLVSPTASRERDGRQKREQVAEALRPTRSPKAKGVRCDHGSPRSGVQRAV